MHIDAVRAAPAHDRSRYRICFLFVAQLHQMLHGLTIAAELARSADIDVHVMSSSEANLAYARRLIAALGDPPVTFALAGPSVLRRLSDWAGAATPPKLLALAAAVPTLRGFDAIALPERTSLILRHMGVRRPSFIHLDHGAGDRAISADPRIAAFDFALVSGEKQRDRFERAGLIRPGAYAVTGYAKFEAADAARDPTWRPFANGRPIVLYNPHFCDLGSWQRFGIDLVAKFAANDRYNLIVAPHVRLCASPGRRRAVAAALRHVADCPHILIDLGSDRSVDMTYTNLADIYIGDVSSQIYEFIRTPRPALFLDAHGVDWASSEDYAHWRMGPVLRDVRGIVGAVDAARRDFDRYEPVQRARFAATFDLAGSPSGRAAAAIRHHLMERHIGEERRIDEAERSTATHGIIPSGLRPAHRHAKTGPSAS
jgi:hypothetical protein